MACNADSLTTGSSTAKHHARSTIRLTVAIGTATVSVLAVAGSLSAAGWSLWQRDGVPLCTATDGQLFPRLAADGTGGAIVVWSDHRLGNADMYAQRVYSSGATAWASDGVSLCTAAGAQMHHSITDDAAGGAIVAWADRRRGTYTDVYAQRVLSSGMPAWSPDGIALFTATGASLIVPAPLIVGDGVGGAIVSWADYNGEQFDIYAQRVYSDGGTTWTANGVPVCTSPESQEPDSITSDGSEGAIVAWYQYGSGTGADIYAQRVICDGTAVWGTGGIAVCSAAGDQYTPELVADGAGGAIVVWTDYRAVVAGDIYAQRVYSDGTLAWTSNGVPLCTALDWQTFPSAVGDGASGAIVAWDDLRGGTDLDIYAQRVYSDGTVGWAAGGIPVCTAAGNQMVPLLTSDGAGTAIVTWADYRSGDWGLYAQQVDPGGSTAWTWNGVRLYSEEISQQVLRPSAGGGGSRHGPPVSDGKNGATVAWYDYRNGSDNSDVFAQRVGTLHMPVTGYLPLVTRGQ